MTGELPKGQSYNDVADAFLKSTGTSPDALTPELKKFLFKLSSEAIDAYRSELLELGVFDTDQLNRNRTLTQEQNQQAA